MAVKAERPGQPAPLRTWPGADAPLAFVRFSALDARLAVEAAKVAALLVLSAAHAPARYGAGLVMEHEGRVIPLVDLRSAARKSEPLPGAPLLVVLVHGHAFGIAVDSVQGRTSVALGEIRAPDEALGRDAPYLLGQVWREGHELYLIDSDGLLGPAVRTYLLKTPRSRG